MALKTRKLKANLGTEILDVDLASVNYAGFEAIREAWQRDPVILLRRQSLTETELIAFSRWFGELDLEVIRDVNTSEDVLDDRVPELFFVSPLPFDGLTQLYLCIKVSRQKVLVPVMGGLRPFIFE